MNSPVLRARDSISIPGPLGLRRKVIVKYDLILYPGEICTLQGPNQSGKTSMIGGITGVISSPERGGRVKIELDGNSVTFRSPADAIAKGIVAVHQDDDLVPSMTIRHQLRLRHAGSRWGLFKLFRETKWISELAVFAKFIPKKNIFSLRPPCLGDDAEVDDQAKKLLERYSRNSGQKDFNNLDKLPREISGGARAVAKIVAAQLTPNIKVLLLDEVFRGVHSEVWPSMIDCLRDWAKEEEVAILAVTHSEEEVIRWQPDSRWVISLNNGEGSLSRVEPVGYRSLAAGLPLKLRYFPIFDVSQDHSWVSKVMLRKPIVAIVDQSVKDSTTYRHLIESVARVYDGVPVEISVEAIEVRKSWTFFESLIEKLADQIPNDGGSVLIVGGGIVLNLGGFAASILHRGVPSVLVPTTIMSVADVAVGSKTSLNMLREGGARKHLVGTYSNPSAVILDRGFIDSLPRDQVIIGLSECLKHGLLQDKALFDDVLSSLTHFEASEAWKRKAFEIACRTMDLKSSILREDPWETEGLGFVLLYGHLHAHSLERVEMLTLSHGICVFLGILIDLKLAGSEALYDRVISVLKMVLPTLNSQLHQIANASNTADFWSRMEESYASDSKAHHHSENGCYSVLEVNSIAQFESADNAAVRSNMVDKSFYDIKNSVQQVLSDLTQKHII